MGNKAIPGNEMDKARLAREAPMPESPVSTSAEKGLDSENAERDALQAKLDRIREWVEKNPHNVEAVAYERLLALLSDTEESDG